MGLDMYLYRKSYVRNWDHQKSESRHEITVKLGGVIREDIQPERICGIIEEVAYWRKANAIHQWFVDNVQDGDDECLETHVEREQLAELVGLCKQVLNSVETVHGDVSTGTTFHPDGRIEEHTIPGQVVAQVGIAELLMPTQSGFFFGSTDYDELYLDDLRETVRQLEPLLTDKTGDYSYRSSW